MKTRFPLALLAVVVIAACGGGAGEPAAPASEPAPAPMDDAAALDAATEYFVTHYNMHHPSMVIETYADDAIVLEANGTVYDGKEAILAGIEADMAGSPTLSVDTADRVIAGNWAVARGTYGVEMTPEGGAPVTVTGNWMSLSQRVGDDWKLFRLLTNYDGDPPAGMPMMPLPAEKPPEATDSPVAAVRDYYQTHFNMGHGSMVATRFEQDAIVSFPGTPWIEGRDAVEAHLNEEVAAGAKALSIHPLGFRDLGDGWVTEGGWYQLDSGQGMVEGTYMVLCRQQEDGSYLLHWAIDNGHPVVAM